MFKKKRNHIVKLSGEIDVPSNTVRINPISGDQWEDFGCWLEATSFMAKRAMLHQGWSESQMKKYIQDYIDKAFVTYTVVDERTNLYKPE